MAEGLADAMGEAAVEAYGLFSWSATEADSGRRRNP